MADEQKLEKWKDETLGERMLWKSRQRRDSTECRGGEALLGHKHGSNASLKSPRNNRQNDGGLIMERPTAVRCLLVVSPHGHRDPWHHHFSLEPC